jgi:hypothetical protein
MTDREKAGLRGPVRICMQEYEHRGDYRHSTETTYNVVGNLLVSRSIHAESQEWVSTWTYDATGRLSKISSGKSGEPPTRTLFYTYDGSGRVSEIQAGEIQAVANGEIVKQGVGATAMDLSWDGPKEEMPQPTSGKVRALYDDVGHTTEFQSFDTQGRLVCRLVRTYDANGHIIEEDQILENPGQLFAQGIPTEQMAKFSEKQLHGLNEAMKVILRGRKGTGVSYSYDAHGRLAEVRQRNFAFETTTAISYNEHGDKSEARVSLGPNSVIPPGGCRIDENGTIIPSEQLPNSASQPWPFGANGYAYLYTYDYEGYDNYENWTQQRKVMQMGPETTTIVHRRTLTYF